MFKKIIWLSAIIMLFSTSVVSAKSAKWTADTMYTSMKFLASHLVVSLIAGQFTKFEESIIADKTDFTDCKINFILQIKSVNTNVPMRDDDLRSANFFVADKYPEMVFKSISFKRLTGKNYLLTGDLTIKDVTKKVTFTVITNSIIKDPWSNTRTGFHATLTINHFDFYINQKEKFGNNKLQIAPEINILIDTEFTKDKL
jgi:polyisoprenoid-binding protein YceI